MQNKPLTNVYGQPPLRAINVSVSKEIIDASRQCNFNKCMVAEAINQKYPGATHIYVDAANIRFSYEGLRYYFVPPTIAQTNIARFDRGESVKPFKFRTDMLAKVAKVIPMGFAATHPKGDNRTNPNKRYRKSEKRRKYGTKIRVNGVCNIVIN